MCDVLGEEWFRHVFLRHCGPARPQLHHCHLHLFFGTAAPSAASATAAAPPPPVTAAPLPPPSFVGTAAPSAASATAAAPPTPVTAAPLPPPSLVQVAPALPPAASATAPPSPLPPTPATAIDDIFQIEQAGAKTSKTPDKRTITTHRVLTSNEIIAQKERARFINLQVSSLFDKWYGESQKRAEAVFSLAVKLQPTIIFIDEIDSFLRSRSSTDHEATAIMKTQFMSMWDGLTTDPNVQVMVMGATNRPQDVDAAILRRMPSQFYVGLPNQEQRVSILHLILQNEETEALNYEQLSELSEGLSGSDLREACRAAAVAVMHEYVKSISRYADDSYEAGDLRRMDMSDLQTAINKVKTTKAMQSRTFQPSIPLD
ncbi:ATPase family AAA domain-containing protein 1 [Elysia marginata]|uniref:ATPase family AAA domain-containing protein 1 n=1 Tax=Elysia marginata TaxID=1093978 RepID=A0AAV4FLS3_9GAST|nr:ATPase family AAA domain-containing protein 1 [Elysia marginata]